MLTARLPLRGSRLWASGTRAAGVGHGVTVAGLDARQIAPGDARVDALVGDRARLGEQRRCVAVFVHEGQLADVFGPGLYLLETNNMPILTTLQHWDHGFKSPFKSEIYFVNTTRFNNLKWGTKNPVILRDPEFGPTRIRAFGTYSVRVADPGLFLREIVGTDPTYVSYDIDFVDPAFAPGTGTPEIGGPNSYQAIQVVRELEGVNIIGADLVEVSPPFDNAGGTAWLGASLMFEMLCVMAQAVSAKTA